MYKREQVCTKDVYFFMKALHIAGAVSMPLSRKFTMRNLSVAFALFFAMLRSCRELTLLRSLPAAALKRIVTVTKRLQCTHPRDFH